MDLFADFNADNCKMCGQCFHQCPVMQLPIDVAKAEVVRLSKGLDTKHVLKKCTSCFSCNFYCPEDCNPTQRILNIWHEKSINEGLPARAKYYIPDSELNFRTYVAERMPEDEKALIESWKDTSPSDEIFYPGCNVITVPYLAQSSLFKSLDIRGSLELCCGETYYRTGQYEMVERAAKRLEEWHNKIGFKKMIIPCTAGMNMFTNVLPKFGVNLDFKVEHVLPWLLSRFEKGELKIENPLDLTVTIQESCYGKFFGDDYMDVPRKLLEMIGCKVIEQELCRGNTLCCGIGGGFSHASGYHPLDITLSTIRTLRMAKKTGAQALASYCAGCLQMFSVGQIAYPNQMPIFHILELVQMAIGEKPPRKNKQRARLMFKGVMLNQFPKIFSSKRFFMKDL